MATDNSRLIALMLLATGLCFAALAAGQKLAASLGVPEWSGSWLATVLYSLLIGYAIGAASEGVTSRLRVLVWIFGGTLVGALIELARSGGLLPGLWIGPVVTATACASAGVFPSLRSPGGRLIAMLILALWLSTVVAGLWTLLTAPTYAEGFVVLAWLVLGVGHLAGALSLVLITSRLAPASASVNPLKPIAAILVGLLLSLGIGIFMMRQEGEMPAPLGKISDVGTVFDSISRSASQDDNASPAVTKADVIALLERRPDKDISQIATQYLLSGESAWAVRFKEETLESARAGRFIASGGSVKYGQRDAMLFGIYYQEVSGRLPNLFTDAEQEIVTDWFADIVESILTPGWVDWLYALPFQEMPEGPYLNQEIGAGALAALASALPGRHSVVRAEAESFLDRKAVGWRGNFRNLDDALKYQNVWMGSALAVARYRDGLSPDLIEGLPLAVEWVKQQMPMAALQINYGVPGISENIDTLAIGAFLAQDPEAKWLLDRQLERIRDGGSQLAGELNALWLWDDNQPSRKPVFSSTIFQGPTGYSFRPGTLAPDKLVLRDDIGTAEWYLLASLRNQGWHRYPATNTVIRLIYGDRQLIAENVRYKKHRWLPKGRATHRDKKIDRSNLNGLQIERTGLDAWIGAVTGIYSRWRQDVPRFATAQQIEVVGDLQLARSDIGDWDGVSQRRLFALDGKNGTLVIIDRATGHEGTRKAVHWHLIDMESRSGGGWTGACPGGGLCRIDFLPLQPGELSSETLDNTGRYSHPDAVPSQRVRVETLAAELAAAMVVRNTAGNAAAYRVSAVNGSHGQALGVSIVDGESEQIFIAGKDTGWAVDGLESNADFARLRREPRRWHLEFFGATVLNVAPPEWACNLRWTDERNEQNAAFETLDQPFVHEEWLAPRDGSLTFEACPSRSPVDEKDRDSAAS